MKKSNFLEMLLQTNSLYSSSAAVNIPCIHLWLPETTTVAKQHLNFDIYPFGIFIGTILIL